MGKKTAHRIWALSEDPTARGYLRCGILGLGACACRRQTEWGKILAVLRAIWLHCNQQDNKGRTVSTDGVIHEVEGLITGWFKRCKRGHLFETNIVHINIYIYILSG